MSNSHSRGEPHQHERLAERFEQRAARLRRQANILLYIIIGVLAVGAGAFVFANDISRFTLQPRTAEAQYAAVEAAEKTNRDQLNLISKQIKEIMGTVAVLPSYDDNLDKASSEYTTLEHNILQNCKDIIKTDTTARQNLTNNDPEMRPSLATNFDIRPSVRIGEYTLFAPIGATIDFSNASNARDCQSRFSYRQDEITHFLRIIQDGLSERDAVRQEMIKSKEPTLKPLWDSLRRLMLENNRLVALRNQLQGLVTQEKILGSATKPEGGATSEKTDTKIDWARVIETNATRIGALVTMFFLVTILVPQYRYNIRMASFYEARSDSLGMLPERMSAEDFDKVVGIMTPNIDFGKAPPTPWEQIIEVIKTAKSRSRSAVSVTSPSVRSDRRRPFWKEAAASSSPIGRISGASTIRSAGPICSTPGSSARSRWTHGPTRFG